MIKQKLLFSLTVLEKDSGLTTMEPLLYASLITTHQYHIIQT